MFDKKQFQENKKRAKTLPFYNQKAAIKPNAEDSAEVGYFLPAESVPFRRVLKRMGKLSASVRLASITKNMEFSLK